MMYKGQIGNKRCDQKLMPLNINHHHKEVVWMNPIHLDHLLEMVNKFKQERDHELGVKRT
jgi:hypothetical protein